MRSGCVRARELSYTARTFTGKQAAQWGLANHAVPLEQLGETVREITDGIASRAAQEAPSPAFKDLYAQGLSGSVTAALEYETNTEYEITDTAERLGSFG